MNNNNIEAVERAMTAREKTAMRFFYQYDNPRTEYEDIVLDRYFTEINELLANKATNNQASNFISELISDAEMLEFVQGYTYAIDRLRETLLLQ